MSILGEIGPPVNNSYFSAGQGQGLFAFISNIFKLVGVVAGIYFIFQVIIAGFNYISASGDSKKTEAAWAQIWQSILGIVIISAAFTIAALVERLTGIPILNPSITGPS